MVQRVDLVVIAMIAVLAVLTLPVCAGSDLGHAQSGWGMDAPVETKPFLRTQYRPGRTLRRIDRDAPCAND
jgi:hypothetical protein